jgi:hypothetical protein
MKIYVVTNDKGEIVATMQNLPDQSKEYTLMPPRALSGQKVHHIELPKDLEGVRDGEKLHQALKAHLRN